MHTLPLLALRDTVVYPGLTVALPVGREVSLNALQKSRQEYDSRLVVVTQINAQDDEASQDNLYDIGVVCTLIDEIPNEEEGYIKAIIEGDERVALSECDLIDGALMGTFKYLPMAPYTAPDITQAREQLLSLYERYAKKHIQNPKPTLELARKTTGLVSLIGSIASRLEVFDTHQKQNLLESQSVADAILSLGEILAQGVEVGTINERLSHLVRQQMDDNQREYYLNEKIKAIKSELSSMGAGDDDDDALEARIEEADLPDEVRKKAQSELKKLRSMPASSSEASVVRGYLECILEVPWQVSSEAHIDLEEAKRILDEDHYGLKDVKERILEYLAVASRVGKVTGSILCLVGPPGVGKTSLGASIARATGREYVRMALGGVRDEAEIRGHRRTYIGAMPGKIVQSLTKVEVNNPLFLLDEIDKMAQDHRGDPAHALLEVLDPSQNTAFADHYLDLDLDLSKVMFVCTANSMDMPAPLLDRMEIIRLPGYTEDEKMHIAKRYLIPKARKENGLDTEEFALEDAAILSLIRHYTREAGVRHLGRSIHKLARKIVKAKTLKEDAPSMIGEGDLLGFLGVHPYDFGLAETTALVGRITGLAWTQVGGELLTIETATMQGKGNLIATGSLGDVMNESIKAALSVVKANAGRFGVDFDLFKKTDVHVHLPEGATPKDGPSAGIALTCALVSAFTQIPIAPDIAMTGEVTLGGKVLRIGGLKEKLLAAHRGGIKRVLIPKDNARDLKDIPDDIKDTLKITPVSSIDEVLEAALVRPVVPVVDVDLQGNAS